MWSDLIELNKRPVAPWTLIGAHMVALHGWALGRNQIRPSRDADVLVDVRAVTQGTSQLARKLEVIGYEMEPPSPEGVGHRFRKGETRIDVLAPDGLGYRTPRRTVGSAQTVMVPGGTQALRRTTAMAVKSRSTTGKVPVPDLLGAILIKARAVGVSADKDAQIRDLAFLLTLVKDPDALASQTTTSERGWLRRHSRLTDPRDIAWAGIASADDGVIAFRRLI